MSRPAQKSALSLWSVPILAAVHHIGANTCCGAAWPSAQKALKVCLPQLFSVRFADALHRCARAQPAGRRGNLQDVFQAHGHCELDTARMYNEDTSKQMLSELD